MALLIALSYALLAVGLYLQRREVRGARDDARALALLNSNNLRKREECETRLRDACREFDRLHRAYLDVRHAQLAALVAAAPAPPLAVPDARACTDSEPPTAPSGAPARGRGDRGTTLLGVLAPEGAPKRGLPKRDQFDCPVPNSTPAPLDLVRSRS